MQNLGLVAAPQESRQAVSNEGGSERSVVTQICGYIVAVIIIVGVVVIVGGFVGAVLGRIL